MGRYHHIVQITRKVWSVTCRICSLDSWGPWYMDSVACFPFEDSGSCGHSISLPHKTIPQVTPVRFRCSDTRCKYAGKNSQSFVKQHESSLLTVVFWESRLSFWRATCVLQRKVDTWNNGSFSSGGEHSRPPFQKAIRRGSA